MSTLDVVCSVFLLSGSFFCLVGACGLLRFPDLLSRAQAATKPQTLGLLLLLIGVAMRLELSSAMGLVLVALLQVVTAPVLSQLVGKGAYRTGAIERSALAQDDLDERLRQEEGPQRSEWAGTSPDAADDGQHETLRRKER